MDLQNAQHPQREDKKSSKTRVGRQALRFVWLTLLHPTIHLAPGSEKRMLLI